MTTKKTASLDAQEITTSRTGRRSAMWMIGGAIVTAVTAQACATGCSDRDPTDPANAGRSCGGSSGCPSGCSDSDSGTGRDPGGRGCRC